MGLGAGAMDSITENYASRRRDCGSVIILDRVKRCCWFTLFRDQASVVVAILSVLRAYCGCSCGGGTAVRFLCATLSLPICSRLISGWYWPPVKISKSMI